MKRAQASKDTPSDPSPKLAFGGVSWRGDPHTRTREALHELLVQTVREAIQQAGGTRDDDVGEQMRPNVDVDAGERALDQLGDGLRLGGRLEGRLRVGDGGLGVEEGLDDLVPVDAEGLVVAVWELEGAGRRGFGDFFVEHAVGPDGGELVGAWPDLHDGFFKFGERAVFQQRSVGGVGRLFRWVGLVFGLGRLAGFDRRLGGNQIVRRDRDRLRRVVLEQRADLRRDVVASQRGMLHASLQDHAVVHWRHGNVRRANVHHQSRCFPGSESKTISPHNSITIDGCNLRCKNPVSRQVECRYPPVLHGDFNGLFARLGGIPSALRHQQRAVRKRLLVLLHLHFFR